MARTRADNRRWYHRHRDDQLTKMREYRERIKDAVFQAYGGYVCACCGETEKRFLTIDHVNNDGNKHRKEIGFRGGIGMYLWIHKNNFPPDFQVLCFNCNHGKQLNGGVCPHQKESSMGHSFDHPRPEHTIHHIRMPQGHGHVDQKLGKGMRAPIVGQLPMSNGLESPAVDEGIHGGEASVGSNEPGY